jgi:hypothetical protein
MYRQNDAIMSCCSLQPTCYGSYAIIDKINHLLDLSLSLSYVEWDLTNFFLPGKTSIVEKQ